MITSASEYKTKMDAKRAILTAANGTGNPELAFTVLTGILKALEDELEDALLRRREAPTSVTIRIDPVILGNPALLQVRNYLINLGYTVTPNVGGGQVVISW